MSTDNVRNKGIESINIRESIASFIELEELETLSLKRDALQAELNLLERPLDVINSHFNEQAALLLDRMNLGLAGRKMNITGKLSYADYRGHRANLGLVSRYSLHGWSDSSFEEESDAIKLIKILTPLNMGLDNRRLLSSIVGGYGRRTNLTLKGATADDVVNSIIFAFEMPVTALPFRNNPNANKLETSIFSIEDPILESVFRPYVGFALASTVEINEIL